MRVQPALAARAIPDKAGREIITLDVLNHLRVAIWLSGVLDDHRNCVEAGEPGGAMPTCTHIDDVSAGGVIAPDNDRL
jgi:hypothetical protein